MKSKLRILFYVFLLIFQSQAVAQVVNDTGDVFNEISTIIGAMPGDTGDNYTDPTAAQLTSWEHLLDDLLDGNYSLAADTASILSYSLVAFVDTTTSPDSTYYLLKETGTNYWGTYVYNPNPKRPLVIQSPHPKKDFNTGKQGIHAFRESGAFFFCLSGTDRCNNASFSSCDGTTSVCTGSSESYRISDLAHNIATIYQTTVNALLTKYTNTYFLQLHGFTKLVTDPYVILSNGTRLTPTTDYIATFSTKLFDQDNTLTFKTAHVDLTWTRLIGFKNTQGRLVNSSSDVCNADATATNGRFIHVEQEKTKLRDDQTGWDKVANALIGTFPVESLVLSVKSIDFEALNNIIYPNPTTGLVTVKNKDLKIADIRVYNMFGQDVTALIAISKHVLLELDMSRLPTGIYLIKSKATVNKVYKL